VNFPLTSAISHFLQVEGDEWRKASTDVVIAGLGWISITGNSAKCNTMQRYSIRFSALCWAAIETDYLLSLLKNSVPTHTYARSNNLEALESAKLK
jgi:hypothetical protein